MGIHSNEAAYRADAPKGYEAAFSAVQLRKWGEVDPEDTFDAVKEIISAHSNEKEYLDDGPKIHREVIQYDPVVAAQKKSVKEEKKWGEVAFEDSPAGVHHAMARDTDEKSYQNDEKTGGVPFKINVMLGKDRWGEIAEEDKPKALQDMVDANSNEGDYVGDTPAGYATFQYAKSHF